MRAKSTTRLSPRERLSRGLTYTAIGPVDVTRGVVGLGVHSAQAGASSVRRRYREGALARDLAGAQQARVQDLAAAQEMVTHLPEALAQARRSQRRAPRPWVLAGAAAIVLAGGAAVFAIVRRSARPKPSALPPSVDVDHRP
jgi:alpha-D-ribose 1-methylphosphonate 5-triphosphate synthase subunit PhnG